MKTKSVIIVLIIIIFQFGTLSSVCHAQAGVKVVATISAVASIVGPVLSSVDNLTILLPSNVEPHSFTLDPATVQKALEADILVSSGHIGWERQVETQLQEKGKTVFNPLIQLNKSLILFDSPSGGKNVHGYWLHPENVKLISSEFTKIISNVNPSMTQTYLKNEEKYISEIEKLKSFALDIMGNSGLIGKNIIIGFYEEQYVAESLGLKVVGVLAGEEENVEISPQKLDEIRKGLLNGTITGMVVSDIALELPLNDYIKKLSDETGKPVYYVRTLDISLIYDFRELYAFNLGNIVSTSGNVRAVNNYVLAPDVYLEVIIVSIIFNIIFGYLLFARRRKWTS